MNATQRLVERGIVIAAFTALVLPVSAEAAQPDKGPLKVFILAGQSNMDGQAETMLELLGTPGKAQAKAPQVLDLDAALQTGDFDGYFAALSAHLAEKVPAEPSRVSEAAVDALLRDPVTANLLCQRQFLAKHGVAAVAAFARADRECKTFLRWLLPNTAAVDLYLEGATPIGINDREANAYTLNPAALDIWKRIFRADPESREGLYLELAIAAALAPPGSGNRGAGMAKTPADPVGRYLHFKSAHGRKELLPSFDGLTVWEYQKVVSSCASDEDLAWAREMLNTWRPDLRVKEQVVNSTSEVWRRDSPIPYTDYKTVLEGGGKCGPRSSWSVMICQAFGIPAIGVGQPGHACVAYKAVDPALEPQPGSVWKVAYGRGWHVSKLEGMSGPDFLAGVEERSRAAEFSRTEHLRWLASAVPSRESAEAIMAIARKIRASAPAAKVDLAASEKAGESDKEVPFDANASNAAKLSPTPEAPFKVEPGVLHIEAETFARMSGVCVYDCFTGGAQVNFQKNLESSWVEYELELPEAGTYLLTLRTAAPNRDQKFDVSSGEKELGTVVVPMSTGLWATTPEVELPLDKGRQALRITAPFQRGVAVRWLELRKKGT